MTSICIVTALPAEAKPLVAYYRMRAVQHPYLKLYEGSECMLLQCGVGKLTASAAVAATLQCYPAIKAIVNVGIAGAELPIGTKVLAHSVHDKASGQTWYPHLPPINQTKLTKTVELITVDQPDSDYTEQCAFDMEASGITVAACKTLDLSFVQFLKIISDNSEQGIKGITKQGTINLIESAITDVQDLVNAIPLQLLPSTSDVDTIINLLVQKIHFSQTQRHTLKRLLLRYKALLGDLPTQETLQQQKTADLTIDYLATALSNAKVRYLA